MASDRSENRFTKYLSLPSQILVSAIANDDHFSIVSIWIDFIIDLIRINDILFSSLEKSLILFRK